MLFRRIGPRASRFGREFFGSAAVIVLIFIMAAHVLSFAIMVNVCNNSPVSLNLADSQKLLIPGKASAIIL